MKGFYIVLFGFLFSTTYSLHAQCPPPGFPSPGNTCVTAPILCENLDGYCATINNNNSVQGFPGCPGWQLNNDEWFAFYAGSTTITMVVTPSNCTQGGQMGLQGGIYTGCGPPWVSMDLQCSCTQNPFTLTATNYVIGQIYWMVLDGCAGNICDYSIDVTVGSTVGAPPANPGAITGPPNVCQGSTSTYTVPPVTGATIYNWTLSPTGMGTTSGTGNNVTVTWGSSAVGPVNLCLTVANACYPNPTQVCYPINVLPRPTAVISGSGVLCAGSSTPVNLNVSFTGDAPWTFVYTRNGVPQAPITTSNNPYTLMVTQPGTYALQSVSSSNGATCTGTVSGSAVVTQTTITLSSAVTHAQCGLSNGAVNLTVSNGTAPYMFAWSSGETTEDLSNIPAGTYTVTVTDANGCTATNTAVVNNNIINFTVTGVVVNNTTCNGGNGSIDVSVNPGGTYTYDWSNGATTQDLSGLPPGTYTVTVTVLGTCTSTAPFTVNDNPNNPNLSTSQIQTTCDLSNGSINLTVSGGVAPYTFNWSNGATTEDLSAIPAGPYTVTVTGANGCTNTATVTLNNNNPPINVSGVVFSNTTCNNGNGSIDVSVSPAGTYTYNWSTGATTQDVTGLTPGTYTVTVSAGGSCTSSNEFTVNNVPNVPVINSTVIQSTCNLSNGGINISVSGSVAPYTYNWSTGATTQNITGLLAGAYTVTVTGANGCTNSASITVGNNNPPITVTGVVVTNTSCNSGNGSINISVSPAGTYTFNWSTGATTEDVNGLTPGTYTVTVTGGGSCSTTAQFTVGDNPNLPVINPNAIQSTCDLSNGSINLNVTGSVPPYTYNWSNGATTQNLTGLLAGSYTVTVTGANGCTNTAGITVSNTNPPINVTASITSNTTCNGGNGAITLTVTPPGVYTFTWSNGATTQNINGLPPGDYTVTVQGSGTCVEVATFVVPDNPNTPNLFFTFIPANCDLNNGSINLTVSGGVTPYTYLWSNGALTQDLNSIPGDDYTVTVTGGNGCTAVGTVALPNNVIPITINATVIAQTSCVINNGRITLMLSPNNLAISWSTGSSSTTISNLAPGAYTVTVSAGGTCTETETFFIDDNSEVPNLDVDITAATCGFSNGAVDLSVSGGILPYTYIWSNGKVTQDISNLPGGNYAVTVTTSIGCTALIFAAVPDEDITIDIYGIPYDNLSCTVPNGYITMDAEPTGLPYTYLWSTGQVTKNISNLAAGAYTVTVTLGSCSAVATIDVNDGVVLPNVSAVGIPAICGLNNGGTDATVNGGTPPYTYNWSNGGNIQDLVNLLPGTYTVTVNDLYQCTATATAVVSNNNVALNISGIPTANTSCVAANGNLDISVAPAGNYGYAWSTGALTQDLNNLVAGMYTVTVSAGTSCSSVATFTVANNTVDPDISPLVTPAICGNSDGAIDLTISGSTPPYTFSWSNSAVTEDLVNILSGNYTVTVTSANGCTSDTTLNVANNSSTFSLSGLAAPLTNCASNNGGIDLTVTPAGPYTYLWSNGALTQDISSLPAGTYTVSVTETGTCTASASYIVNDALTYPTTSQTVTSEICGLANGAIDLSVNGGATPYTFVWSGAQMSEDLNGIATGTYTVTVSGANNCTVTATANVPGNSISFSLGGSTVPNSSCIVNNGAIDLTVTPSGTYTYIWSNAAITEDLNGISGANYTVTVSAGGACTNSATYTVDNSGLSPLISQSITPGVCGQNTGAVNLSISGGQAPYTFIWSTGAVTEDVSGIVAGNYTVTVTDAGSCTASEVQVVPDNVIVPTLSGIPTPNTSCVVSNGSVNLSATPALPYTYIWSNGQASQNLSNVGPGTYTVTVNGGGACTAVDNFTVGNNTAAPVLSELIAAAFCGQNSGSVDLTAASGVPPYTFTWSNGGVAEDIGNLVSGNYTVTVNGANGCSSTATIAVPENSTVPVITATMTPSTSCVSNNGVLAIAVTPALNYTFIWSNGAITQNLNGVAPGVYTVTVNGGGACTGSTSFTITSDAQSPSIAETISPAFCAKADGGIDLVVTGGETPYTFAWSNAGVTEDLNAVLSGTYTVTVTGSNGCTVTGVYMVPDDIIPPLITGVNTPSTSCVSNNGALDISVTPAPPYTYVWSGGQISQDLSGLAPGIYTVTVNGGGGCTATAFFTVVSNTGTVLAGGVATNILCFGNPVGAIDLSVSGGTPPYTYAWSPVLPGNPQDPSGLSAGNYALTVTDIAGCTANLAFTITQPAASVQLNCVASGVVNTPGASDGAATVAISGGIAPYTVVWSPGLTQANVPAGNFAINNLSVGNYLVTVTDANSCTAQCNFTITLLPCGTAIGTMSSTLLKYCGTACATAVYNAAGQFLEPGDVRQFILHEGSGNQIVNEIARSAQPTFCFDPATMNFGTTYYISAAAGNNDGSGNVDLSHFCTVTAPGTPIVFYDQPVVAIAVPEVISCAVLQVTLNGSSSLPGSGFAWTSTGGLIIGSSTQAVITAGKAGTYTLVISSNGCLDTAAVQVTDVTNQPLATITASPDDILDCTIDEIVLSGTVEGTFSANTVWISNGSLFTNGATLEIDVAGTYQFIILDTLTFCSDTAYITIDQNQVYPPLFVNTPGTLTCVNPVVTLSGGSPVAGINFVWATINGSDTTQVGAGTSLQVTLPGTYYLIGNDPNNTCTNILGSTVSADNALPVADAGTPFSLYCYGETAFLDGSGSAGAPVLNFVWTTTDGNIVAGYATNAPKINEPGSYLLRVTNPANGCTDTDEVVIPPKEPVASAEIHQPPCAGDKGYILVDSVSGAKPPIRYSIDNGQSFTTQNLFANLNPGDYTVFIEDANGCSTSLNATINPGVVFEITLIPQVLLKLGESYQIITQISGPPGDIQSISWNPSTGLDCDTCLNPLATPLVTTQYRITASNKVGCTDSAPLRLLVSKQIDIYVPNIFSPDGDGDNDVFMIFADNRSVKNIKSFQVYSRWGERVWEYYNFQPNNPNFGWDGKHRGQDLNPAVFVWYAVVELIDGQEILLEGDVTLKR